MKIISKYKDYYDYLVHQYGIDNHIILDRREGYSFSVWDLKASMDYRRHGLAICGTLYYGVVDKDGVFYWNNEITKLGKVKKQYLGKRRLKVHPKNTSNSYFFNPEITDINDKLNSPIVHVSGVLNQHLKCYPELKNLNIAGWYSPEKIYMDIYNWLSAQKEEKRSDNLTDLQKIESKGFDKITSFRKL